MKKKIALFPIAFFKKGAIKFFRDFPKTKIFLSKSGPLPGKILYPPLFVFSAISFSLAENIHSPGTIDKVVNRDRSQHTCIHLRSLERNCII